MGGERGSEGEKKCRVQSAEWLVVSGRWLVKKRRVQSGWWSVAGEEAQSDRDSEKAVKYYEERGICDLLYHKEQVIYNVILH
jgi:hypothetical protein